ncbi:hypothetical protein EDB92DRAFT_1945099 [Lactarius akahatsu]|uniref:Uncharacterized protein n=1 Tax=Lactarius akahatsu TaxID=416441 RepID=A0AAD4LGX2_9AGAM|nr:hypothetical protein EDB92DRAFT_1945099 [Lactarius akahatsu]
MPKRTFTQIESSSPHLPLKRIHTSTPAPRSVASPSSAFSTPYTPSVYSTPADSPTNPLGLKRRVNNLTLPKATPFSKHVALRFQLITPAPECVPPPKPSLWNTPPDSSPATDTVYSKNPAAEKYAREGTYRVVQAPLSYSFRLLRAVILFIFSGDPSAPPRAPGHLFSVQHGISIGSPGEITRGRVRVKLSRARDPYYSSRSLADLIAAADAQGQDEEDLEDEEEDASWRWEGEDDLTLGHVWDTRSRDPKRGIIYHHDDQTSVHITLNTQTVPHRKGVGNMPFVFRAYGTAHLDPPRSPPSTPAPGAGSTFNPIPASPAHFPDIQAPRPEPATARAARKSGRCGAKATRTSTVPLPTRMTLTAGSTRACGTAQARSRASSRSSAPPHTLPPPPRPRARARRPLHPSARHHPPRQPAPRQASLAGHARHASAPRTMPYSSAGPSSSAASLSLPVGSASWAAMASSSPVRSLPSLTPAPARPRTRYRVARAARRLLGLTERGLESEAAEEADVVEGRVQGQSKKGRRVDARKKDRARTRTRTTRSATTEVWNPFAHLKDV